MKTTFKIEHSDGVSSYTRAPDGVEKALRRRFECPGGLAAMHPDRAGWYLFDVRNWWDGPSEIRDNGDGTLTYANPWTGGSDTFAVAL